MNSLDGLVEAGNVHAAVSLAPFTTYKLGGNARWFAQVDDVTALGTVAAAWQASDRPPLLIVGRGSNLVVADGGFDGLVVKLGQEFGFTMVEGPVVTAGGSVPLPILARTAVGAGRLGLEWFVGIPGSVGGAVHQNAGCHGSETVDRLVDVDIFDFARPNGLQRRSVTDLDLGYRHSNLAPTELVVSARFQTDPGLPEVGEIEMRAVTRWRKIHQPGGTLNAGSVFKNPAGDSAGRLIDECGLKGLTVGGASVSERHANFFVAGPAATAADVFALVREVGDRVAEKTGVALETEILFAGAFI